MNKQNLAIGIIIGSLVLCLIAAAIMHSAITYRKDNTPINSNILTPTPTPTPINTEKAPVALQDGQMLEKKALPDKKISSSEAPTENDQMLDQSQNPTQSDLNGQRSIQNNPQKNSDTLPIVQRENSLDENPIEVSPPTDDNISASDKTDGTASEEKPKKEDVNTKVTPSAEQSNPNFLHRGYSWFFNSKTQNTAQEVDKSGTATASEARK